MKKIFWIGSPFFVHSLKQFDWEVYFHNFETPTVYHWQDIVDMAGWVPDVVVVADKSRAPFVLGVEKFPCLTVLYCVDSHIHSWYPHYAQAFDVCLMSLKDHMPQMAGPFLPEERVWWSPAFAKQQDIPAPFTPEWDVLFVGNVSEERTPKRFVFLQELRKKIHGLHVTTGNYKELYAKARIILNYCEHGDLNFRVFEAMGCGGCLVTPRVGHGQDELFTDGEDYFLYDVENIENAVSVISHALSNDSLCRSVAQNGFSKVDTLHREINRAKTFSDKIMALNASTLIEQRLAKAEQIHAFALRLLYLLFAESEDAKVLKQAYMAASKQH